MTTWISHMVAGHYKLLPIVGMAWVWIFYSGSRSMQLGRAAGSRGQRILQEVLLYLAGFGGLFALLAFSAYGLVDPANHLARAGARPVSEITLAHFAALGYGGFVVALVAGLALELLLRAGKEVNLAG